MKNSPLRLILLPFSLLYGLGVGFRNILFDLGILKQHGFSVFILCVGNLHAGGTGKTPHVIALAKLLRKNYSIAILTRGYKRQSKGFRWVSNSDNARITGDEALEMKLALPEIPVATDGNRKRGILSILTETDQKPDIIIMDDGFQHRSVKADFNLLLFKHKDLKQRNFLLPAGSLRESIRMGRKAQAWCITGAPEGRIGEKSVRRIKPRNNQLVISSYPEHYIEGQNFNARETDALLLTSIADPDALYEFVHRQFKTVKHLRYSDHYNYKHSDIQFILRNFQNFKSDNKLILTTGKDWVKLMSFEAINEVPIYPVRIRINFNDNGQEVLLENIINHVKGNSGKR